MVCGDNHRDEAGEQSRGNPDDDADHTEGQNKEHRVSRADIDFGARPLEELNVVDAIKLELGDDRIEHFQHTVHSI